MSNLLINPYAFNAGAVDAVDFDGTNDYMTRGADLTGLADGKQGILSFWFRKDGGDGSNQYILANDLERFRCIIQSNNKFMVDADNVSGNKLFIETAAAHTASATWKHFLSSWDLATAGARFIYISDAADLTVTVFTNDTIDYTDTDWSIGVNTSGSQKFNGCLAELFFHTTYLDISVEANRRKFISASGKPVDLGADGSTPLGVQPLVYQRVADGAAASTFATNLGSGGNFTITGSLDIASTSPSD